MSDVKTFNKQLDKFLKDTGIKLVTFQKKVSFEIFRGVILKTPVDTGYAQNNWNISVGEPDLSVLPEGGTYPRNGAIAKLLDFNLDEPYQVVFITNNLPYIVPLEEGWSDRAPSGMVQVTVNSVNQEVNNLLGI